MFRTALLRSARCAVSKAVQRPAAIARPVIQNSFVTKSQFAAPSAFHAVRCYSAAAGLSRDEVTGRILDLLKNFDKLTPTSHFSNDLGLDSLDTVEVVMAIEEVCLLLLCYGSAMTDLEQEFSIEIPDKDADAIHSGRSCLEAMTVAK
ncbi:mitochondrial acyl carrier protein [Clarireedia jacksonii]